MRISITWLNKRYVVFRKSTAIETGSLVDPPNDWEKALLHYLKTSVIKGTSFSKDIDKVDFFLEHEPKVSTKHAWLERFN